MIAMLDLDGLPVSILALYHDLDKIAGFHVSAALIFGPTSFSNLY